jgi:uncharacterized protein (TIGR03437 family)
MVRLFLILVATSLSAADSPLVFRKVFGSSGTDTVLAAAADPSGYVIVGGNTSGYDFPVTDGSRNVATQFAGSANSGVDWRPLSNVPGGARVIAVDNSTQPIFYAGSYTGIFKSVDGAASWMPLYSQPSCNNFDPACGVYSLSVSGSTIYAVANRGIVRSTDGGATWTTLQKPGDNPNPPNYLAADPFRPDHVFTAVANFLYRSLDGGKTWMQYNTPAPYPTHLCGAAAPAFDSTHENIAYLADQCTVFRSDDGGLTWSALKTPFDSAGAVTTSPGYGTVFALSQGLWESTDSGATWNQIYAGSNVGFPVAVDPSNPNVIIAADLRTADGGATWTKLSLGRHVNALVFDPSRPGRAIAATQGAQASFIAKLGYAGEILAATYLSDPTGTFLGGLASDANGNIYAAAYSGAQSFYVVKYDSSLNIVYEIAQPELKAINGMAVDPDGNAVTVGSVAAADTNGQLQCLLTKFTSDGSGHLFTKAFPPSGYTYCTNVASDASGNTIVVLMNNGVYTLNKLDGAGNVLFSQPVLSGVSSLAVDPGGAIYLSGATSSRTFPSTDGAFQTQVNVNCPYYTSVINTGVIGTVYSNSGSNIYVQKLDPNGNVLFSTLLGGDCLDQTTSIAMDSSGNVWVSGRTDSNPFPQAQPFESGPPFSYYKAFVSEFDPGGRSLLFSSYVSAGSRPVMAADPFGNVYVAGNTEAPQSPVSGPCCVTPAPLAQAALAKIQNQPTPQLSITAAGNAFSLHDGPVSAGQITLVTVAGLAPDNPQDLTLTPSAPLPRLLSGVQVLFDGEAAAVLSVGAGRVVVVAPYDLVGKSQTSIQVAFNGTLSPPVLADVLPDQSYLSRDGTGTGEAVAFNPDGTPNSTGNPAPVNANVTVYATGAGKVDPSCKEGGVATSVGSGDLPSIPGYLCGVFKTTVRTFASNLPTNPLPNSPLTIAVK